MWSRVIKSNAIYLIGNVANSFALFLLIPYLVNALTPSDYGAWSLFEIMVIFLTMLIPAGMDVGLMREYWFLESEATRKRLSGTVLIAVLCWGLILTGLAWLAFALANNLPGFDSTQFSTIRGETLALILAIGLVETLFNVLLAIFRIREQAIHFAVLSVSRMVLFLGLAIFGVQLLGNVNGALWGRLLAGVAGITAAGFLVGPLVGLEFDRSILKRVLTYGLPLVPANLAGYILVTSDRYFLSIFSTLEIIAVYSFAYKLSTALDLLVIRPFAIDWAARRFLIATQPDAPRRYADILELYLFASTGAALVLLAFAPFVYRWIAPAAYQEGLKLLPVLVLSIQVYGLSYPLNIGIVIKDRTSYAAAVGIIAALVCLGVEFWLIPRYGMAGAAWSTLIGYLVLTGGLTLISLRLYPVPYRTGRLAAVFAATLVGYFGLAWLQPQFFGDTLVELGLLARLAWLGLVFGVTGLLVVRPIFQPVSK